MRTSSRQRTGRICRRTSESNDLRRLSHAFEKGFGEHVPFSDAAFVILARLFYYLSLQESLASLLLLDPLKIFDTRSANQWSEPAGSIIDLFDAEVGASFRERKARWLGSNERSIPMPILSRYVLTTAEARGWNRGRMTSEMRQSREVVSFRSGLGELHDAIEAGDSRAQDAIFHELDAAATRWSEPLGARAERRGVAVTASLPFFSVGNEVPLPRLRRSAGSKLLVLIDELMRAA